MASKHEQFWSHARFAVVGHTSTKPFPKLTYRELKSQGKTVYPVDPSAAEVDGDVTYPNLVCLPGQVDAVVLEVPKGETADWVQEALEAGIENIWIHQFSETPRALALAHEGKANVLTHNCAMKYLSRGPSIHSVHRRVSKALGRY
jgi:uncharacterized protein